MKNRRPPVMRASRGFSLMEAVVIVIALAISIPPTISWLGQSAERRADAVMALRATSFATLVMENVIADSGSDASGLGFDALANSAVYLDTPVSGLRARLASPAASAATFGISYTVTIGPLVDSAGVVNSDAGKNMFRVVTVVVNAPSASGGSLSVPLSVMVTELVA